jgi:AraC family transcriptional regulator
MDKPHARTFAERLEISTAERSRFTPDRILLQDSGTWPGLRLEQWATQGAELPEVSLFQHAIVLNMTEKAAEIRWSGHRWISGSFRPGTLGILPARLPYRARSDKPSNSMIVALAPQFVQSAVRTRRGGVLDLAPKYGIVEPLIQQICLALAHEVRAGYPRGPLYGESLAVALAAHLARHHGARGDAVAVEGMHSNLVREQIREFIHDRLHEALTLADMARFAQTDVYSFTRWFKKSFGMPPHKYVMVARIERAKQLVANGLDPLADVALASGFNSQSHLTTTFRRFVGVSPLVYRDCHRRG